MERKLASIQIIRDIQSIPDAEFIETATINDWKIVINKREGFKVGDKVIYCEIDSFLPIREEFEFLRKTSYKKVLDQEGFRLKTIKLKGQISQGLILPLNILDGEFNVNDDVTELLGIVKYDPPIDPSLAGLAKGNFPSFIQKTDEERIQNLTDTYEKFKNMSFYATEKLDGTSTTYFVKDGVFGYCSRNLELQPCEIGSENTQWRIVKKYELDRKLIEFNKETNRNIAIQGELIGNGIQNNNYKLKEQDYFVFTIFDIDNYKKLGLNEILDLSYKFKLNTVPIIKEYKELPSIEKLIEIADGQSALNHNSRREGLVFRSHDNKISFKVISNKYLLKNEQ